VHPYGLEVSGDEWNRQGASGDVITVRKDGVTVKSSYQSGELDGEITYTHPYRSSVEKVEIYSKGRLVKESQYSISGALRLDTEYPTVKEKVVRAFYSQGNQRNQETYAGDRLQKGVYYSPKELVESTVDDFNGKATQRDLYGQLISVDTIDNGEVVSITTYHPNGMPEAVTPYVDGLTHGTRKTFLPGGEPLTVEEWVEGYQEGPTFVYQDGEKVAEVPYCNGQKNGIEKRFRQEDEVVEEVSWSNDVLHGPTVRYVEGQVFTEYYYNGTPVTKPIYDRRTALLQP
jgi:antitoxin component YwqK of YwqJK toxin-antitoxin module